MRPLSYDRNRENYLISVINFILVPLRLIIPQPIIAKVPLLRTNEDERCRMVLAELRGKALDIGCGRNKMIQEYRQSGQEGLGVDIFEWGGPDLVVENTAHLPFDSETFDCVSFIACLNHIPNRSDVLNEARRVIKPGGRILITNLTPFVSMVWHKIAFWDADQNERGMKEGEVWGFNDTQLKEMVGKAGFHLVKRIAFMWGLNHLYIFEPK